MTPIITMASYIEDEFAAVEGQRLASRTAHKLARAALQGLLDDLAGNVRCAALAERALAAAEERR